MKRLNLNSIIKVKLTDRGKDVFYHQYDSFRYPDVDNEGYSKFQLWDFMHIYGHTFILGNVNEVIKPLDIFIEDEDLEDME